MAESVNKLSNLSIKNKNYLSKVSLQIGTEASLTGPDDFRRMPTPNSKYLANVKPLKNLSFSDIQNLGTSVPNTGEHVSPALNSEMSRPISPRFKSVNKNYDQNGDLKQSLIFPMTENVTIMSQEQAYHKRDSSTFDQTSPGLDT